MGAFANCRGPSSAILHELIEFLAGDDREEVLLAKLLKVVSAMAFPVVV